MSVPNPSPHGDETEIYRRHHDEFVLALIRRFGVTRDQAEDAVQFAFLQLLRHQPDREYVDGWLFLTAKRELFAHRAKRNRELATAHDTMAQTPAIASIEDQAAGRAALRLIDQLTPHQATVLRMRIAGLSYKEIRAHTGHNHTWVNRHVTEGRAALRKLLDSEGGD